MATTVSSTPSNGSTGAGIVQVDTSPDTPSVEEGKIVDKEAVECVSDTAVLDGRGAVRTAAMKRRGWYQFAALCMAIYVAGWNDGTLGPLLPRLQEVYHVGSALV